ncbi:MAG: hypothetical protein ACRCTJ_03035, partial [Brevinema sp.]
TSKAAAVAKAKQLALNNQFLAQIKGKKFKTDNPTDLEVSFTSTDKAEFEKDKTFSVSETGDFALIYDKTGLAKDKALTSIYYLFEKATSKDDGIYSVYYTSTNTSAAPHELKKATDAKFHKVQLSTDNSKVSIKLETTKSDKSGMQKLATQGS